MNRPRHIVIRVHKTLEGPVIQVFTHWTILQQRAAFGSSADSTLCPCLFLDKALAQGQLETMRFEDKSGEWGYHVAVADWTFSWQVPSAKSAAELDNARSEDFNFMVLCASKNNMAMYQLLGAKEDDLSTVITHTDPAKP